VRRREFITLLGGAVAGRPLAARAQQPGQTKRVGFVIGLNDAEAQARFAAFRQELDQLGWISGRNIQIVPRFGAADSSRNLSYVEELMGLGVDVVVTSNSTTITELVKRSRTLPIVITNMSDPVTLGLAENLARPGGNVTGFTNFEPATGAKWLELLRELIPSLKRAAVMVDPLEPDAKLYVPGLQTAASSLGFQLTIMSEQDDAGFEKSIDNFAQQSTGGLIVPPGAKLAARRALFMRLAAHHRLPAIFSFRYVAAEGGLMSYGPDALELYRRPAAYVDRILKGAKPAELPIQQPTKFELAINLKTAKALGITFPISLLGRADEVIE
jgi:putative tryptophan/tyrosine transport system substrate-binding protein